jgi:hypothetical protein
MKETLLQLENLVVEIPRDRQLGNCRRKKCLRSDVRHPEPPDSKRKPET